MPFPEEKALVMTTALMIDGIALMPKLLKASTNGLLCRARGAGELGIGAGQDQADDKE